MGFVRTEVFIKMLKIPLFTIFRKSRIADTQRPQIRKPLNVQLNAIQSQTAQLLYSTDYVPKSKNLPNSVYKTFVLDAVTKSPVDIFVKHKLPANSSDKDKFFFYGDEKFESYIGERAFRIDNDRNIIGPGHMHSYDSRLIGLGIRGHQLAIEMMQKLRFPNVEIHAVMSAYEFHRKCGFNTIAKNISIDEFLSVLPLVQKELNVPENILKQLIVYMYDKTLIDESRTFENFTKYMLLKNKSLPFGFYMPMQLSEEALKEWNILANHQPILNKG